MIPKFSVYALAVPPLLLLALASAGAQDGGTPASPPPPSGSLGQMGAGGVPGGYAPASSAPVPCLDPTTLAKGQQRVDLEDCKNVFHSFATATIVAPDGSSSPSPVPNPVTGQPLKSGIMDQVQQHFSNVIDCYRQGYMLLATNPKTHQPITSCPSGMPWAPPSPAVCEIKRGELRAEGPAPGASPYAKPCGTENVANPSVGGGRVEKAYMNGLFIPVIRTFAARVLWEALNKYSVSISPGCQDMAGYYDSLLARALDASNTLTQTAISNNNLPGAFTGGVNYCASSDQLASQLAANTAAVGGSAANADSIANFVSQIPVQSFCQVTTARMGLVTMFTYLLNCEVWARSQALMATQAETIQTNLGTVTQTCMKYANAVGNNVGNQVGNAAGGWGCGHDCATAKGQAAGNAAGSAAFQGCWLPVDQVGGDYNAFAHTTGNMYNAVPPFVAADGEPSPYQSDNGGFMQIMNGAYNGIPTNDPGGDPSTTDPADGKLLQVPPLYNSPHSELEPEHPSPLAHLGLFPGFFFFGTLGGSSGSGTAASGRRRRWLRALRGFVMFLVANVAILAFSTYYAVSGGCCGGDSPVPPVTPVFNCMNNPSPYPTDQANYPQLTASCCVSADPSSPDFKTCQKGLSDPTNTNNPQWCQSCAGCNCSGASDDDKSGGAGAGGVVSSALDQAKGLGSSAASVNSASPKPPAAPADLANQGNTAAASAGGAVLAKKELAAGASPGPVGAFVPSNGNGGAGTAGGGAGGSGGTVGDLTTAPSSGGDSSPTPDGSGDGGAYGSGGGAKAGGTSSAASGGGFGYNSGDKSGTGGDIGFGAQGAVGDLKIEDPDDYFARTNLDESIFKKVERKYGERSRLWMINDAHVATPKKP